MNWTCLIRGHRWTPWEEVGVHLERECLRCGDIQAKWPPVEYMIAKGLMAIATKYLDDRERSIWP